MSEAKFVDATENDAVALARQSAKDAVAQVDEAKFSEGGFVATNRRIGVFIDDLVNEASRVATREGVDLISASHVERAATRLASRPESRLMKFLGNIGGVLLGAAVPNTFIIVGGDHSAFMVISTIVLGIVGASLVTLQAARD